MVSLSPSRFVRGARAFELDPIVECELSPARTPRSNCYFSLLGPGPSPGWDPPPCFDASRGQFVSALNSLRAVEASLDV
jgi:hypothetical protein